jgi:hypothetical protein
MKVEEETFNVQPSFASYGGQAVQRPMKKGESRRGGPSHIPRSENGGADGLTGERFRYLIAQWPNLRARSAPGTRRRCFFGRWL